MEIYKTFGLKENLRNRVMAPVYPTPHTNAERMRVSSGRIPLYDYSTAMKFINFAFNNFICNLGFSIMIEKMILGGKRK